MSFGICIKVPARVVNVEKAIEAIGGIDQIAKVWSKLINICLVSEIDSLEVEQGQEA